MPPLFSDFKLNTFIQRALAEVGYIAPTPIQEKVFSAAMSGADICGIAQTGTGKTLAYLLPVLNQWRYNKDKQVQILIIAPTRELALQIKEEAQKVSRYLNCVCMAAYGGINLKQHAAEVSEGVDLLVGTPGRLLDLLYDGYIKPNKIKKLILDEVDELLNLGFRPQLDKILEMLPEKRQNLLFTATMTPDIELIINDYFNRPLTIEAAPSGTPLDNITQYRYQTPNYYTKINLIKHLLATDPSMQKVLLFAATKQKADECYELLTENENTNVGIIHSNKSQNYRIDTVKKFESGEIKYLIATDIIARGIDISQITHVINTDVPEEPEAYMHRIGRTGRATQKGTALLLTTPVEQNAVDAIEALMQQKIEVLPLPPEVPVSATLSDEEIPVVKMKTYLVSMPDISDSQGAFHEKKEKNKKVNIKISHTEKMKQKYGKPKTRGQKKR
ncbi:MAG: DEAD/DEAH box helicase [Chitinophagia bacterium]|nr:DEAD/DEAH box helicase [Chitinophagia bacterium]